MEVSKHIETDFYVVLDKYLDSYTFYEYENLSNVRSHIKGAGTYKGKVNELYSCNSSECEGYSVRVYDKHSSLNHEYVMSLPDQLLGEWVVAHKDKTGFDVLTYKNLSDLKIDLPELVERAEEAYPTTGGERNTLIFAPYSKNISINSFEIQILFEAAAV